MKYMHFLWQLSIAQLSATHQVRFPSDSAELILAPKDGSTLRSSDGPVNFYFNLSPADRAILSDPAYIGPRLCFTVQNKRESYQAWTQCIDDPDQPFHLSGVGPGVWCARAYLAAADEPVHWRGGHLRRLGGEHTIFFAVDVDEWRSRAELDERFGIPAAIVAGNHGVEAARLKRLRAFDIAREMGDSSPLRAATANVSHVVVTMANAGHLSLTLNLLSSLRAFNVPTVAFALDAITALGLAAVGCAVVEVPLGSYCRATADAASCSLSTHRDVWSPGFADVAVLKPACVLAVIRTGTHALWLDTDIVVFRDPFPELWAASASSAAVTGQAPDVLIQAGGSHHLDVPVDDVDSLRNELCTGLYLARSTAAAIALFEHTIHILALHESEVRFGDQSATNLAMFEAPWRAGLAGLRVSVLDALLFPTGGVYFESGQLERRKVSPALVHNNYLIGHAAKVQRFRDHGLWLDHCARCPWNARTRSPPPPTLAVAVEALSSAGAALSDMRTVPMTFLGLPLSTCPLAAAAAAPFLGCARHPNVLFIHPCADAQSNQSAADGGGGSGGGGSGGGDDGVGRRTVVVLSLGHRPWFETLVLPRLAYLAARCGAHLLVLTDPLLCSNGDGLVAHAPTDGGACAKRVKLDAAHAALSVLAERVAVVDDTLLFRKDAKDPFQVVPSTHVGGAVENESVRAAEASTALASLALLRYARTSDGGLLGPGSTFADALARPDHATGAPLAPLASSWFNTGFVVLSRAHLPLLAGFGQGVGRGASVGLSTEVPLDPVLLYDQGLLNARRLAHRVPLTDLGLDHNWLGSFNGSNAHRRPCDAVDAFAVHATTGLPDFGARRADFLGDVAAAWASRGL